MDMNQFQRWTPWLLRNYCSSRAVIVIEIAATGDAAVRRMGLLASRAVEFVKALHAENCSHDDIESEEDINHDC